MDAKRIFAVSAVMLMLLTALVMVVPVSDAETENTMQMKAYVDANFARSEKKQVYYNDWGEKDTFYTNEVQDELFQKFIDGESDEFMKKTVSKPSEGKAYYVYSFHGYDLGKKFQRGGSTWLILPEGMTGVCLLSNVSGIIFDTYWSSSELEFNKEVTMEMYGANSARLYSNKTDFENLKPITIRFDDPSVIPEKCEPEEEAEMSTDIIWYHGTVTTKGGWFWDKTVCLFPQGSAYEQKFVDEVIDGGKSDFKPSDYGMLQKDELPAGTYSAYSYEYESDWMNDTDYVQIGNEGAEIDLFRERQDYMTMFTKANTAIKVGMEYDDSLFTGYLKVGYETLPLSSGYLYSYDVTYATEIALFLEPLSKVHPYEHGDVKIMCSGTETETGSPAGLAAVCIILAALVFVGLFLFNRKPHW